MSDYYKSLISDDEVIKELIKESKRREGKLPTEATRLKPNLNFFQRTVNNLISNNTRIDKSQYTFKTEYLKDCNVEKPEQLDYGSKSSPKQASADYAYNRNMVIQRKINFVKSSETFKNSLTKVKKKIEIKKINFVDGVTGTPSTKTESGNLEKNDMNSKKNKKFVDILANSEDSSSDDDLILILSDDEGKTTCKSITNKNEKTELSSKKNKSDKQEVIYISTDDSIETVSSDLGDRKKKKKVKKKKKLKNELDKGLEKRIKKKSKKRRNS